MSFIRGLNVDVRENLDLKNNSLQNAVIDATGNTISNLTVANLASGVLDTDLTSVSASDDTLASAKAIKAYVDGAVTGTNHDMGSFDASGGTVPTTGSGTAGAILKGDFWHISVAGTISGVVPIANLQIGDLLYASIDGADTGAEFFAIQGNVAEATTTVLGLVMKATEPEAQLKAVDKVVTAAGLAAFARQKVVSVTTDGIVTSHTVVHNLGKALKELSVELRDATTEERFFATVSKAGTNNTNQFVVSCSPAYPSGGYNVVITGL